MRLIQAILPTSEKFKAIEFAMCCSTAKSTLTNLATFSGVMRLVNFNIFSAPSSDYSSFTYSAASTSRFSERQLKFSPSKIS